MVYNKQTNNNFMSIPNVLNMANNNFGLRIIGMIQLELVLP